MLRILITGRLGKYVQCAETISKGYKVNNEFMYASI